MQSYISAAMDMALSILALGLNQYAHHSWEMKINWWCWIFSQQAGVLCSVPPEWMPPSGSPLHQNREQSKGVTSLLSSLCSSGSRAGLTSQVLVAISLAEPDQQRQGDNIKIGLSFQPSACFFTCKSCPCNIYPQMTSEDPHCVQCLYFLLVCLEQYKSIKERQFHLQELEAIVFCPINTSYTVLYYLRELHQTTDIAGTNYDPRACKKVLPEAEGLGCTNPCSTEHLPEHNQPIEKAWHRNISHKSVVSVK